MSSALTIWICRTFELIRLARTALPTKSFRHTHSDRSRSPVRLLDTASLNAESAPAVLTFVTLHKLLRALV